MTRTNSKTFTVKEAALYLGFNPQTLYQLKHQGKGPKCTKVEVLGAGFGPRERIRYTKPDLDAWNKDRLAKKQAIAWKREEKAKNKKRPAGKADVKKAA